MVYRMRDRVHLKDPQCRTGRLTAVSSFLYRLGLASYRQRWRTLLTWLLVLALLGGLAGITHGRFDDKFSIPGASSQAALDQLQMNFPQVSGTSATMLVVAPPGQKVGDAAIRDAVESQIKDLKKLSFVDGATSPWDKHVSGLVSRDSSAAIVQVRLPGEAAEVTDAQREALQQQGADLQAELPAGAKVAFGGEAFAVSVPKMSITEVLGLGVALVVLLLTLGSLVAAGMPLLTAVFGVGLTMCLLMIATGLARINSTTPMLAVMLGLAVGIDYALFILSRHREQLRAGVPVEESAGRAVATAGSAVVFAGLTVIIALVGLGVAGIPFLTVMGIFAALGVAMAVVIALTMLPALMGLAGERMRPRPPRRRTRARRSSHGGPARFWVRAVTKVPALTIAVVLAAAVVLTLPAQHLTLALPNAGRDAPETSQRISYDLISEHFGPGFNGPLIVTAEIIGSDDPLGVMDGMKADIEKLPGVQDVPVSTPNQNADTGFVQVIPTTGPDDPATKELVQRLRDLAPTWQDRYDVPTAVTGATAIQIDVSDRLEKALLPFGIFVVGLSLVLLTMVFRSIWVPVKATLGYLLSVGVAFGMTAWVFNEGHVRQIINLDEPGPVISFLPILLMGILFGLAMDYEVFLVSRMREDYVHGKSAREAIESGFIGSSTVVTAAAAIMFFVFAFFVPEGEGPIKSIAFALAVGVAFDAFVVRMTLVPAVMALLGSHAWWLPRKLDKVLPTFDVEGETMYNQLRLAEWPHPEQPWPVYAEGLAVDDVFGPVDAAVAPGRVLIVEGPPAARAGVLLTLAGRMRPDAGRARVAGHLVPEESSLVRAHTSYIDVTAGHDISRELRRLERASEPIVLIDGADAVHSHDEHDLLVALLRDLPASRRVVLLGVAEAAVVAPWCPDPDVLSLQTVKGL